ncbi:methyltransferase [Candidatus Woesearchaeota archaeon]|nr:methyltransferase [Candidatus Woesearchaeota archaeon]
MTQKKGEVYMPREDTYLLLEQAKKIVKGKILEVGIGSGYISCELAKLDSVGEVLGVDINPEAVAYAKENSSHPKVKYKISDLFGSVSGVFDFVVCNPPYLPQDKGIEDISLYGGKKGYEFIDTFLRSVEPYLKDSGSILLLFSSLSRKDVVEKIVVETFFESVKLSEENVGNFETLYVYKISKRREFVKLKKLGVRNFGFFSRGKRGLVFTANYKDKKVGVKVVNKKSDVDSLFIEANNLKRVNDVGIGPKLLLSSNGFVVYEFAEGETIVDWVDSASKSSIRKVLVECFRQLRLLDELSLDKKEMSHPQKHIIVGGDDKVTFLDFERSKKTNNLSNVTGFCQFITSTNFGEVLRKKGFSIDKEEIIRLTKEYKKNYNKKMYEEIVNLLL